MLQENKILHLKTLLLTDQKSNLIKLELCHFPTWQNHVNIPLIYLTFTEGNLFYCLLVILQK